MQTGPQLQTISQGRRAAARSIGLDVLGKNFYLETLNVTTNEMLGSSLSHAFRSDTSSLGIEGREVTVASRFHAALRRMWPLLFIALGCAFTIFRFGELIMGTPTTLGGELLLVIVCGSLTGILSWIVFSGLEYMIRKTRGR